MGNAVKIGQINTPRIDSFFSVVFGVGALGNGPLELVPLVTPTVGFAGGGASGVAL